MSDDFSWDDDALIVVKPVDAIAVYETANADIVVRVENGEGSGEDTVLLIPREYARAVATAINRLLKKGRAH